MANGAEGDIRNAVHSLQFYCLKPGSYTESFVILIYILKIQVLACKRKSESVQSQQPKTRRLSREFCQMRTVVGR